MPDPLKDHLEAVFSILSEDQAEEARRKTLQNFLNNRDVFKNELKWANFDRTGKFLGGGASDIGGLSVRVINNPSEDEKVSRLTELAKNGGATAGLMEYSISQNCIYWFLPTLDSEVASAPQINMRGLVIPELLFQEFLDLFNAGQHITPAERHLAFQMVAGLSLRDAAEADGLAFETKRAQLKSLCTKTQCGGQNDLLRLITGQMTYLLSVSDTKQSHSDILQSFANKYLSAGTRILLQRLPNGRSMQILELGPSDGKPVLLIHGMLWPLIFTHLSDKIAEYGIRLIVPLRSGYLGQFSAGDIYGSEDNIAQSLDSIAIYHQLFLGMAVPVIGHSYGGAIAAQYAAKHPDLVANLFIVSINAGQLNDANRGFIGKFFGGVQSLTNQKGMLRYLTWQFKKYYSDEKTVRRILRKMFGANKFDKEVMDGRLTANSAYPWFVDMYQKSIPGIADDFAFVMGGWQDQLRDIEKPICFIHGEDDPVVDRSTVEGFVEKCRDKNLEIVPGAGHHLLCSHPDQFWSIVSKHI